MIETNSDFIDSYITNNNGNIINKDIDEYLMDIEINYLNVLHMNIRTYNRNIDEFWCLINDSLKVLNIIILSETWNGTGFTPQNLSGFSSYKSENNFNQNDGVLIYTNNKHNIVNQLQLFSRASCIKLDLKISNTPITSLAAYRSPQTNTNIFLSELSTIMTSGHIQKNCIWIGDINIDILEKILLS
ncbi:otoferlin-like [Aphis craccivora]|uniref:Otoferlin-like n=1 Tax=Aphis craccivora TaxID=307492 RepID=A0A6G0VVD2_APHCR|nr:otoferlin-like [Aphis craccivora]